MAHRITIADCVRIFILRNRLITAVPLSPYGLNKRRILRVLLDLKPEIADVDHDRVVGSVVIRFIPHGFIEMLGGEDLPAVLH